MSPGAIFTKKPKKPHHGSRIRTAASLVANILGEVGGMVPVVGSCIEGVAKAAKGLLESLEEFENNREDMQDLAEEIRDIVIIIRDAGIEISETPESIKYADGLRKTCLKFQEFLCTLSAQVNKINRSKGGVWGNIVEFLNHGDVKASISHHRKLVENARSNFQSQVMLDSALVLLRNSASISHLNEQMSSIQSILLTLSQANNGNTINDEEQIARQYRMPGGGDLVGGFQEMGTVQSGRNTHSVSASKLVEWLCQLQCCLVFLRWLHFRWSLSLKFEISLATPSRNAGGSRTWAVLIGIDAYLTSPLRGCVADALLMQRYAIKHLGVPKGRIQLLTGSDRLPSTGLSPTRRNIMNTLISLSTNPDIHQGDEIIIYFAGHGNSYPSTHSSDSYTHVVEPRCGPDSVALRPLDYEGIAGVPAISDQEINAILHRISIDRKARITFILDCNQAFGFSRSMVPSSYVLLAASQEFQNVREKKMSHGKMGGVFTNALVETLTSSNLKDRSTYGDLLEALGPLMGPEQTPAVIGEYRDAPIWFRD